MVSKKERIYLILHLCVAFTLIIVLVGFPYLDQQLEINRQKKLIQHVQQNGDFYGALPSSMQQKITERYGALLDAQNQWGKGIDGVLGALFKGFIFYRGWLFFSVLVPIMVLLGKKGAREALVLLPLLAVFYGIDGRMNGKVLVDSTVPTERHLEKYGALSDGLENAFQRYLLDIFGDKDPQLHFYKERILAAPTLDVYREVYYFQRPSMYFIALLFFLSLLTYLKLNIKNQRCYV